MEFLEKYLHFYFQVALWRCVKCTSHENKTSQARNTGRKKDLNEEKVECKMPIKEYFCNFQQNYFKIFSTHLIFQVFKKAKALYLAQEISAVPVNRIYMNNLLW